MAIIKKDDIIKSSDIAALTKELDGLTESMKDLQDQTRKMNKDGSGREAKERIKITKKFKDALTAEERVKQQILKANKKLAESRTEEARELAEVNAKLAEQKRKLREAAKEKLGFKKRILQVAVSLKTMVTGMIASVGILGGLRAAFRGFKNLLNATAEGQIFMAKVTGATNAIMATLRDTIIDAARELIKWIQLLKTDAGEAAKSFGEGIKDNVVRRLKGFKVAIIDAGAELEKGNFRKALSETVDGLIQVATGTEKATEKTKEYILQLKIMADFGAAIAGSQKRLALERARFARTEASTLAKINDLRLKARQRDLFTAEQRKKFIEEAISLQEFLGSERVRFAKTEAGLQEAVFKANISNIDEEIELEKVLAKQDEEKRNSKKRLITLESELQTIKREIAAEEKTQTDRETQARENNKLQQIQSIKFTGQFAVDNAKKTADDISMIQETHRKTEENKRLKHAEEVAEAEKAILLQARTSALELAGDIFDSFIDARLAKSQSEAEAQKKILQDRLDKGIISEEEFANKVAEIDKKQRIEAAKAEKKKAIFDIAIATALAVAKAGFITPAAIAIGVIGAIQAAAIAAKPIPEFEEGQVNIHGKSHSEGGILANIEGGESVINKRATSDSEGLLNAINSGIITDRNFASFSNPVNRMANLERNTAMTNFLLSNGLGMVYTEDGFLIKKLATGKEIKKRLK
jgi:hypothetical protein